MQTIFAYRQCEKANYGISLEFIEETFSPDLNSMEVQDKELLNTQKKEAIGLYKKNYNHQGNKITASDKKVEQIVTEAINDHHTNNDKDLKYFKKNMLEDAEKILDQYVLMLMLIVGFHDMAANDNRGSHTNFVKNLLIDAIKCNKSLENISLQRKIDWASYESEVRQWFKELVKQDDEYNTYLNYSNPTFEKDKAILQHIVKNVLFKSELIDKFMEEQGLNWSEDRAIVKSLAVKTIKSITPETGSDFELQELSYNWEDDKAFFVKLFEDTMDLNDQYEELISKKTKNWDIERIATTDKIILEMAISEMINFSSIPVKVTINEYIEVAKKYSTPKSKLFINGVLDVIATELTDSGAVKKSGRGLIDSK